MVKLFACGYEENKADILLDKMSFLSLKDRERIFRYKREEDRCESFLGLSLVYGFWDKTEEYKDTLNIIDNYDFITRDIFEKGLSVSVSSEGKPYFEGREDLYFNISHSGNICIAAVADCNVGVDLQKIKVLNGNVAARFFTKKDNEFIHKNETLITKNTIKIWCIKESYVKMLGSGLGYGLDKFEIDFKTNRIFDFNKQKYTARFCAGSFDDEYEYSYCVPSLN